MIVPGWDTGSTLSLYKMLPECLRLTTASVSQVPTRGIHEAGLFVTNSGGTRASDWSPEFNQLWIDEAHGPGRQLV